MRGKVGWLVGYYVWNVVSNLLRIQLDITIRDRPQHTSANNMVLRHWSTIFQSIGRDEGEMTRVTAEVNRSNVMLRNLFMCSLIKYPIAHSNLCKWLCFCKCN